jgi:low affinity Fe/Cu permease
MKDKSLFVRFANWTAGAAGRPQTFVLACVIIVGWALTGPLFDYSDTWQLVINTSTTIITFLMVFVIQNTQNRDSKATQIKLDELIRAMEGAHNALLDLEQLTEGDLNRLRERYIALAAAARTELTLGHPDTGHPELAVER